MRREIQSESRSFSHTSAHFGNYTTGWWSVGSWLSFGDLYAIRLIIWYYPEFLPCLVLPLIVQGLEVINIALWCMLHAKI